ncbi:MAG: hypothetical protein QW731_03865 [Thermofilaceae archaeon]
MNRLRSLPKNMPFELIVPAVKLIELNIFEIIDPLLEEGLNIVAVKPSGDTEGLLSGELERLLILMDELGAEFAILPVDENNLGSMASSMQNLFHLAVIYSKRVALEPTRSTIAKVTNMMYNYLGGVLKLSISPSPSSTTEEVIALTLSHISQVVAVKLTNFVTCGKATRLTNANGTINIFTVVRELLQQGYDSYFIVDYEAHELELPSDAVREDFETITQYIYSIREKVS